jgi:hypothetical protein
MAVRNCQETNVINVKEDCRLANSLGVPSDSEGSMGRVLVPPRSHLCNFPRGREATFAAHKAWRSWGGGCHGV